jgi:hypothetical protein
VWRSVFGEREGLWFFTKFSLRTKNSPQGKRKRIKRSCTSGGVPWGSSLTVTTFSAGGFNPSASLSVELFFVEIGPKSEHGGHNGRHV